MNELIEIKEETVIEAFSREEGLDPIIQQVKDVVSNFEPDLRTAKSRAEITSLASNVARFKGKVDDLGKNLVSGWKAKSKAVDDVRKNFRDELDAVKVIARMPLTDWETEQEARIAAEEAKEARIEQEKADQELAENLRKQFEQDHEMALLLDEKYDREAQEEAEQEEQQRKDQIEADRVAALENKMLVFTRYLTNSIQTTTVEQWTEALAAVKSIEMSVEQWEDHLPAACQAQLEAIAGLESLINQRTKYDADQIELKRLQDEAAETKKQQEAAHQEQLILDREAAAATKKAENKAHQRKINNGIVKAITDLGASKHVAQSIVTAMAKKQIANTAILY